MEDNNNTIPGPIHRSNGITPSERYLQNLCDTAFLKLWSYPGVYRDQGKTGSTHEGKEVCDLLVVFGNHIIIFSDKSCDFPDSGDLALDWCRWYRRAILSSAKQIWGAERWIKRFPDRFFLDRKCTQPFPYELPQADKTIFHRIVVARNSAVRSRGTLGGSGSLMIFPHIIGEAHINKEAPDFMPLSVGQIDPEKGFVHVLDDTSLDILLHALDTITDFVNYLIKKEKFILSGRLLNAAGEEELLAHYLINTDDDGNHDFIFPDEYTAISIGEGRWDDFQANPQRKAQIEVNKVSYLWDTLIEKFNKHLMGGTLAFSDSPEISDTEKPIRFLARETRFRRRIFSNAFLEVIDKSITRNTDKTVRLLLPSEPGEPCYIFLVLLNSLGKKEEDYRNFRRNFLSAHCQVAKLLHPHVNDFVGIAVDHPNHGHCSEDLVYLDARNWTENDRLEAIRIQGELEIFVNVEQREISDQEYPDIQVVSQVPRLAKRPVNKKKTGRNEPCPCGSNKKYKRCCLE